MNHKFTLGVIAGIGAVSLAVPVLAQISSAASADTLSASTSTSATAATRPTRPAFSIANVQDMITRDTAFLKNADAILALQKSVTQTHLTALTAAAGITDDTARQTAVKKANDDMRAAIEAAVTAHPDLKSAMMPGFGKGEFGGRMGMGHGPMGAELATKLGMTETELKAALESGKTIEQIATEKGITLPARPAGEKMGFRGHMMKGQAGTNASAASSVPVQ